LLLCSRQPYFLRLSFSLFFYKTIFFEIILNIFFNQIAVVPPAG
jgi:hypothetical protein